MRQTNDDTSVNLKLVMLFDWRRHIYCICSHNLSAPKMGQRKSLSCVATGFPLLRWINVHGMCRKTLNNAKPAGPMFSGASIHRLLLNTGRANSAVNRHLRTTNGITP